MTASETETDAVRAAIAALEEARQRTLALVEGVSEQDLVRVHSPLMSPLVWDLGHIAAFEDLWLVHRVGGEPMVREDLAAVYDAFETPRPERGDLPFLGPSEARAYLGEVRERVVSLARARGIADGSRHEMVTRHEHQHCETMLQTIQLARLPGYRAPGQGAEVALQPPSGRAPTGLELVEVPAGPCWIGAPDRGFAYDNERPRHRIEVDRFAIGRTPVTNRAYLDFVSGGGYEQPEWWSERGWEYKQREDVRRPAGWNDDLTAEWRLGSLMPLDPARPVVHVSWFEAEAFARAHGVRLPTELEWEKASSWDPVAGDARRFAWGDDPPIPGLHGNLDQVEQGPVATGSYPAGESPCGAQDMIGQVWEWTASTFDGYPGFSAYPYREYSEVFFGQGYPVLRGGSWATRAWVATASFRNWDLPQRRQIFAGIRIAR